MSKLRHADVCRITSRVKVTCSSATPKNAYVSSSKFAGFAKIACDYYELHLAFTEIQVTFTQAQLEQIGDALQAIKDSENYPFDIQGNIKRAFVMAQKIAAILTLLEECESGSLQEKINCSDKSLETAIELITIFMLHALNAYELLPSKVTTNLNDSQKRLLQLLPEEFTKVEGAQIGVENGLSQRNSYYAIKALETKGLIKLDTTGKLKKQ